jgi:hypothetical protein
MGFGFVVWRIVPGGCHEMVYRMVPWIAVRAFALVAVIGWLVGLVAWMDHFHVRSRFITKAARESAKAVGSCPYPVVESMN